MARFLCSLATGIVYHWEDMHPFSFKFLFTLPPNTAILSSAACLARTVRRWGFAPRLLQCHMHIHKIHFDSCVSHAINWLRLPLFLFASCVYLCFQLSRIAATLFTEATKFNIYRTLRCHQILSLLVFSTCNRTCIVYYLCNFRSPRVEFTNEFTARRSRTPAKLGRLVPVYTINIKLVVHCNHLTRVSWWTSLKFYQASQFTWVCAG